MSDHQPRPPTHAALGDEYIHRQSAQTFRLTTDGWRMMTSARYPQRDVTSVFQRWPVTALVAAAHVLVNAHGIARRQRDRWDDRGWAAVLIDELAQIPVEVTVPSVIEAVRAVLDAYRNATEAASGTDGFDWSNSDDGCAWRRSVRDLRWACALNYPTAFSLPELVEIAADDIHGGCTLSFDGDCFAPPPWSAYISGWPFATYAGGGDTPEVALLRAMWQKQDAMRAEAAKRATPEWQAKQAAELAELRKAMSDEDDAPPVEGPQG